MRRLLTLLVIGCCIACHADTMVKSRTIITDTVASSNVQSPSEQRYVYYRKGAIRRKDSFGDQATATVWNIANCDARTGFLIDQNAREYRTYKLVKFWPMTQLDDYLKKNPRSAIQIESNTIDTGERKTFFGHNAKHLVTTTKRPQDQNGGGGEETIDGWYIEHEVPDDNCAPDFVHTEPYYLVGTGLVMYPEIAQFHHTGPVPTGLAVKLTHRVKLARIKDSKSDRVITLEKTVEDLSDAPLSPSLFELPSGFHENPRLLDGGQPSSRQ